MTRALSLALLICFVAGAIASRFALSFDDAPAAGGTEAKGAAPDAAARQAARGREFDERVRPFLAKYCVACHGGSEPESDLALDRFTDIAAATSKPESWGKMREYLRSQLMPPPEETQPTAAERKAIVDWIEAQFSGVDCGLEIDPGRVTIRRLNRTEYNNTIRDLIGLDFHPADDFPADDVGYGFDHIGDVLSMPPILLEKYLSAAEDIAERAIYVHTPDKLPKQTFAAAKIGHKEGNPYGPSGCWMLPSTGEVFTEFEFAKGDYILRSRAVAPQTGVYAAKISIPH